MVFFLSHLNSSVNCSLTMQFSKIAVAAFAAYTTASPVVQQKKNLDPAIDDVKTLVNDLLKDVKSILGDLGTTVEQVFPSGSLPQGKREWVNGTAEAIPEKRDLNKVAGDVEGLAVDLLKDVSKLLGDLGLSLVDVISHNGLQGLI